MKLHRIMCLALCLGVAFSVLTGSALASGTTRLFTANTKPATYASELTLNPATGGNVYTLVHNPDFNSDIFRDMTVARTTAQNFTVVVTLGNGAKFATGRLPQAGDVGVFSVSNGAAGAASFTVATGGLNGSTSVTFLSNITTSFQGFPTLIILAGGAGWTIKDVNNQLATGPITVMVQTFDAADGTPVDLGGTDTTNLAAAANAVIIPASQQLVPTTAVVDVATNRQNFVATPPDTTTVDNGATIGVGYATPPPLALSGAPFVLAPTDKVTFTFTSNNDFTGLTTAAGVTTGIQWVGLGATGTGATRTITVFGNDGRIGAGALPFIFTVNGTTQLPTRIISVALDLVLAAGGSTVNGGTRNIAPAAAVTTWTFNGSVLVANWVSGFSPVNKSRIYLWNPSAVNGLVTVRVFTMPLVNGGATTELTTPGSPLSLGTLGASSSLNIRVAEDILEPLNIPLPYQDNGGNLVVEITIRANGVRGTCQVFAANGSVAFGQVPLMIIQ